jgi:hypothetical protein
LGISPANTGLSEIPTMIFTGLIYKGLLDLLWNSIWDGSVGFPDGHGSNMIKPSTWKPSYPVAMQSNGPGHGHLKRTYLVAKRVISSSTDTCRYSPV